MGPFRCGPFSFSNNCPFLFVFGARTTFLKWRAMFGWSGLVSFPITMARCVWWPFC